MVFNIIYTLGVVIFAFIAGMLYGRKSLTNEIDKNIIEMQEGTRKIDKDVDDLSDTELDNELFNDNAN